MDSKCVEILSREYEQRSSIARTKDINSLTIQGENPMKWDDLTAFCLFLILLGIWGFTMCGITVCLGIAWIKSGISSGMASIKRFAYKDGEWRY